MKGTIGPRGHESCQSLELLILERHKSKRYVDIEVWVQQMWQEHLSANMAVVEDGRVLR